MASTVARTAHVSESDVVQSTSESPGIASADSQYSNSRSSSPDHPKSDPEQDASAQVDHRRCLWSDSHQLKSLEDIQCHIFGCVPFRDRIKVLRDMEKPNGFWHKALELDLEQHPDVPWMKSKPAMKAKQRLEFIRYLAVLGIKGERKRIRIIRSEIKKRGDKKGLPDDKNGLSDDNNGSKGLFEFVASSLHAWRHSDEYNNGLIWVREWRAKHDKTSIGESLGPKETKAKKAVADEEADEADEADTRFADELSRIKREYQKQYVTQDRDTAPRDHGIAKDSSPKAVKLYDLERDVKVHILQFEPIPTERPGAPSTGTDNDIDPELDGLMQPYQEQGGLLHKEVYKEQFPNQVISVESFLTNEFKQMTPNGRGPRSPGGGDDAGGGDDPGGGSDPGSGPDGGDEQSRRFRWFHIPYNNMEVSFYFPPSFLFHLCCSRNLRLISISCSGSRYVSSTTRDWRLQALGQVNEVLASRHGLLWQGRQREESRRYGTPPRTLEGTGIRLRH